ncbi:MAG: hypothetical protein P9M11_09360, partial [Candidatus Tenebribacter burtonii]|nr:hypothetical protein [Candidatus Tenebribacter burtonii]
MKKYYFVLFVLLFTALLNSEWVEIGDNTGETIFGHSSSGKEYTEVNFSLNGYELEPVREGDISYQKISYWDEGNS